MNNNNSFLLFSSVPPSFLSALHLTTHAPNLCGEIRIIHSLHAKNLLYSFPIPFTFITFSLFYNSFSFIPSLYQCFPCLISLCSICFPFIFMNQCSCPMISGIYQWVMSSPQDCPTPWWWIDYSWWLCILTMLWTYLLSSLTILNTYLWI